MRSRYSMLRQDLETARDRLNGTDQLDIAVSMVLDQLIETVLQIEHMKGSGNIIQFPLQRISRFEQDPLGAPGQS